VEKTDSVVQIFKLSNQIVSYNSIWSETNSTIKNFQILI